MEEVRNRLPGAPLGPKVRTPSCILQVHEDAETHCNLPLILQGKVRMQLCDQPC